MFFSIKTSGSPFELLSVDKTPPNKNVEVHISPPHLILLIVTTVSNEYLSLKNR